MTIFHTLLQWLIQVNVYQFFLAKQNSSWNRGKYLIFSTYVRKVSEESILPQAWSNLGKNNRTTDDSNTTVSAAELSTGYIFAAKKSQPLAGIIQLAGFFMVDQALAS